MQLVGGRKQESFTCCCIPSECLELGIKMNNIILGVGINDKQYPTKINAKITKQYYLWYSMLKRCYCQKYQKTKPTYVGCTVSDNFKSYSYFYEWCNKQIGFGKDGWHLDKDIIHKNNKVYSEYSCSFVPSEINCFFCDCRSSMGEWPKGVYFDKERSLFRVQCMGYGKEQSLGRFNNYEEAHQVYKQFKEKLCKEIANKWKSQIDIRVYDALLAWTV